MQSQRVHQHADMHLKKLLSMQFEPDLEVDGKCYESQNSLVLSGNQQERIALTVIDK